MKTGLFWATYVLERSKKQQGHGRFSRGGRDRQRRRAAGVCGSSSESWAYWMGWPGGWPDPRDQGAVTYDAGHVLTQLVYQILAGYSDSNDANAAAGRTPCSRRSWTSRRTMKNRRWPAARPWPDSNTPTRVVSIRFRFQQRPVLLEQQDARTGRVRRINDLPAGVIHPHADGGRHRT